MAVIVIPLVALAIVALVVGLAARASRRRPTAPWQGHVQSAEERRALQEYLRDRLDRRAFGSETARAVWRALAACPLDRGLILDFHRDYCGHGLIRTRDGVKLCEIQDGCFAGPAIAEWTSEATFVAFFARQSDFSCSGWDPDEPVFYTADDWHRCNQRLTRDGLERFAAGEIAVAASQPL